MELCEGSLKDYFEGKLERIPKDSLDDKILIGQVALGLAYIHDKGIIHKDLKLENILLKQQSPRLVLAKIADFGFAKELKPGKSYGIPFVPAERNDNKRALDAHSMISAT